MTDNKHMEAILQATEYIRNHGIDAPEVGVILGTGLGNLFVKEIKNQIVINYNSIPHFPISTVEYHKGQLIYGFMKMIQHERLIFIPSLGIEVNIHSISDRVHAFKDNVFANR